MPSSVGDLALMVTSIRWHLPRGEQGAISPPTSHVEFAPDDGAERVCSGRTISGMKAGWTTSDIAGCRFIHEVDGSQAARRRRGAYWFAGALRSQADVTARVGCCSPGSVGHGSVSDSGAFLSAANGTWRIKRRLLCERRPTW
jgi:hypothetical protein